VLRIKDRTPSFTPPAADGRHRCQNELAVWLLPVSFMFSHIRPRLASRRRSWWWICNLVEERGLSGKVVATCTPAHCAVSKNTCHLKEPTDVLPYSHSITQSRLRRCFVKMFSKTMQTRPIRGPTGF